MERYKKTDANTIKLIAVIAMTIDHVTWMIYPGYPKEFVPILLHIIGRLTCPIMCYFIAEGYHYTKNLNKYTVRLFLFAFISHFTYVFASMDFVNWKSFIPFYYGSILNQTSVMWSLAWGVVMLRVVNCRSVQKNTVKVILIVLICLISFPSDWSCVASLCILALEQIGENSKHKCCGWFSMWRFMRRCISLQSTKSMGYCRWASFLQFQLSGYTMVKEVTTRN